MTDSEDPVTKTKQADDAYHSKTGQRELRQCEERSTLMNVETQIVMEETTHKSTDIRWYLVAACSIEVTAEAELFLDRTRTLIIVVATLGMCTAFNLSGNKTNMSVDCFYIRMVFTAEFN